MCTVNSIHLLARSVTQIAAGISLGASLLISSSSWGAEISAADLEFFESRVRPLLIEHCYECHSAKHDIEAGLRLDHRNGLLTGGDNGAAIVPGKPADSRLIDAIEYDDVNLQMPPDGKLSEADITTLTEWIQRQAPWPYEEVMESKADSEFDLEKLKAQHWCWQPISNPTAPQVLNQEWPRDPIDRFVLAQLEANDLAASNSADRVTLLRRLYFDLIGLPPRPHEVEAFLNDRSDNAIATVVDKLLDSPHFGERWARHWMDLMRFAESHGHEFDYPIHHAHQYRDYLIRAFNADVPYDQFVIEHLAGDLVASPRRHPESGINESVIGTAFYWLGEATHAPVDVKGDEAGRIDNQIDVIGKSFLGLTVACARCHDHKFDAISTKDYYSMSGFLQSSRRNESLLDPNNRISTAIEQIRRLRTEGDAILGEAIERSRDQHQEDIARYLLAAREAMFGKSQDDAIDSDELVYEDFEVKAI